MTNIFCVCLCILFSFTEWCFIWSLKEFSSLKSNSWILQSNRGNPSSRGRKSSRGKEVSQSCQKWLKRQTDKQTRQRLTFEPRKTKENPFTESLFFQLQERTSLGRCRLALMWPLGVAFCVIIFQLVKTRIKAFPSTMPPMHHTSQLPITAQVF